MINKALFETANEIAENRGISVEEVLESAKKGLIQSFKKTYGNSCCRVEINPEKKEILLFAVYKVVEELSLEPEEDATAQEILLADAKLMKKSAKVGDIIEQKVDFRNFSRTAVSAAKNTTNQSIKQSERDKAYEYFKGLENEMVVAEISNIGDKVVTLKLGYNVTTILPRAEFANVTDLAIGQSVRVYVKKVEQTTKEPKVYVSRTDRALVTRLMENYIPEIKDGIIEIKGIARDPGDRSKIALYSNDPKIDAIGSCVGEAGLRIRQIVDALGGEKVDLYKWSENPEELIANSLQPAAVTKVLSVDLKEKSSVVIVPDDHLSLAIGKMGQNVRLAVQSCGWKIDIMPVSEAYDKVLLI